MIGSWLARRLGASLVLLVSLPAFADQAKARKKLDDEYIPFTAEKFHHYVFMGDRKMVALFLEAGMDVNTPSDRGTALHRAAGGDDQKLFEMLMKAGADPNAKAKNGDTPLCRAAGEGQIRNVNALLAAGADVNAVCGWGRTALHEAAEENSAPVVNALVKAGAAIEARDERSDTPLAFAAKGATPDALNALLAAGADPNAKLSHGETVLHEAVDRDSAPLVKALLAGGAAIDARDGDGRTPLHRAANYDRAEIIPILLAAGADPDAKDKRGESVRKSAENARSARAIDLLKDARKVAAAPAPATSRTATSRSAPALPASPEEAKKELARSGFRMDRETWFQRVDADDARVVGLFLKAGFDPATRNESGRPALWQAVEGGHTATVSALLAGGASANDAGKAANPQMEFGATLVAQAVDRGDLEILKALVGAKADVNKGNTYRMTPLMVAARIGRADMVEVLLSAGANPNAEASGVTALFGPVQGGHADVVKLLLSKGAKVGKSRKLLLENAKDPAIKKMIKEAA